MSDPALQSRVLEGIFTLRSQRTPQGCPVLMHLILMHSASCLCLLLIDLKVLPFHAVLSLSWESPRATSALAQQHRPQILHRVQVQLSAGITTAQMTLSEALQLRQGIHRQCTINACGVCMLNLLAIRTQQDKNLLIYEHDY